MTSVLAVRLDNEGDVLLTGPAIRALAAGSERVTLWCGPRGARAAELLPGVDDVLVHLAAWIDPEPPPLDRRATLALVERIAGLGVDRAIVFTSFHQSPLPTALLLRLAGVGEIAAISEDYPGSLLDIRHRGLPDGLHEVERALSLAATLGYRLPPGDHGRLAVKRTACRPAATGDRPYVVVHPGASVPARAWPVRRHAALVDALVGQGWRVVVTGSPGEAELTAAVAGDSPEAADLGGRTTLAELAEVLAGAAAVVVGNTGPAHLAAAVGTPVVSLFAPTVPVARWRPYGVPLRVLFRPVPCAGCRARICPVAGHPCLAEVEVPEVLDALGSLLQETTLREEEPA
jgi:ADP-heptose:LPS heptosyltransferase